MSIKIDLNFIFILLVVLKIVGAITVSWYVVCIPLAIHAILAVLIFFFKDMIERKCFR